MLNPSTYYGYKTSYKFSKRRNQDNNYKKKKKKKGNGEDQ